MGPQWSLVCFTLFLSLSGGVLAVQGLLTLLGKGRKTQTSALALSAVALVAGIVALVLRMQHWERVFNTLSSVFRSGTISGLSAALWLCVLCAIVLVLFALFIRRSEEGEAPRWCGAAGIVAGLALPAFLGNAFRTAAMPEQGVPVLDAYYVFDAVLLGASVLLVLGFVAKGAERGLPATAVLVGAVGSLATTVAYAVMEAGNTSGVVRYLEAAGPTVSSAGGSASVAILNSPQAGLFWGLVIVLGLVVPAVLALLARRSEGAKGALVSGVALVCALAGSIVWRCLI